MYLLDDTCAEKTKRISAYLLNHPEWTRVAYSDTERNGWAVFERVQSSSTEGKNDSEGSMMGSVE